jgi:SulP family sulfate permease
VKAVQRPSARDFVAGFSVGLVLIPQAMAYAALAGLPSRHGLFAAAVAPIAASFFASSPYLQTGPVALTALLTFGALVPLAAEGSADYVRLAALLALVVGITRVLVGVLKGGWISYMMSRPMLDGFASGAAILIISSQLPGAAGVQAPSGGVLPRALWTLAHPGSWEAAALVLTVVTMVVIYGGRRIRPLMPGVLIATVAGLTFSIVTGYTGPTVGDIPVGFPPLSLDLPWTSLPVLVLPGFVIALVGFAETTSIARIYATRERIAWSPNQEFISMGAANVASSVFGGFPVGGSFSRSSLNYLSGARTRWSGAVTGATVLVFLPFAQVLGPLPRAILSAIVIAAAAPLIRLRPLASLWSMSRPQAAVGWITFVLTLWLAPHIEQAVVLGILAAVSVHIWREMKPGIDSWSDARGVHLKPKGVLWFGSAAYLEQIAEERMAQAPEVTTLILHLGGLGRIDFTGALVLRELTDKVEASGLEVALEDVPEHAERILQGVLDWGPPEAADG